MKNSVLIFFALISMMNVFGQSPVDTNVISGKASFYHDNLHGLETSSGEIYDKDDFTAAHRTLPFNSLLLITNKKNNKSVIVKINDRGPFIKSRILDLSRSAAKKIGMVPFGVVPVRITILNYLNDFPIAENLLNENEIWDCFGNKKDMSAVNIFIWKTDNWKHAFYMASNLSLDFQTDSLVIQITGKTDQREYKLLLTGIVDESSGKKMLIKLRKEGFSHARIIKTIPSISGQHNGQSPE